MFHTIHESLVRSTNNMVLKHGDLVTDEYQQINARWRVIGNIELRPLTTSQIAKLTAYTRQSIQRLADYEKEWVARITQPLHVEELTNLTTDL